MHAKRMPGAVNEKTKRVRIADFVRIFIVAIGNVVVRINGRIEIK